MLGAIFLVGLLTAGKAPAAVATATLPLHCNAGRAGNAFPLPPRGASLRFSIADDATWLEIEEGGQRLSVPGAISLPQPLRYGWHWIAVQRGGVVSVNRAESLSRARGDVRVTLHCSLDPELLAKIDWMRAAAKLGSVIDSTADADALSQRLADVRALEERSQRPIERAIALHFGAEALAANSRSKEAAQAFEAAESAWSALRDDRRALGAHLGRVEELRSTSAYQQVLDLTPDPGGMRHGQSYFVARLVNDRCLSLQALGRLDHSERCFAWLLAEYQVLQEDAEYVVAAQNQASVQRDLGRLEAAEALGLRGLAMATGSEASLQRGRLHLMLSDILLRRGHVASSLAHARAASGEFDQSRFGANRWQANTLLVIASLYSDLGAYDEAYEVLADAVRLLAPLGAASRMAYAMNVFADLETNSRHYDSALLWRRAAEETYARLGELPSQESTRTKRLELQAEHGDPVAVRHALANPVAEYPLSAGLTYRLRAELALHEHRLVDARHALDALRKTPQSLRDEIRYVQLEASFDAQKGDVSAAEHSLLVGAARIRAMARQARSPVLSYVITRQLQLLRQTAFAIVLGQAGSDAGAAIDSVWPWVFAEVNFTFNAHRAPVSHELEERFNRAVASELLAAPARRAPMESPVQRELLSLLALPESASEGPARESPGISLARFQQSLDPDVTFLAYLDGNAFGMLLTVTREKVSLYRAAPPDQVLTDARTLRELLRSADSPVAAVDTASRLLSKHLFGTLPASEPPRRLYVLDDELSNRVAWSTLSWPGHREPLVDSTSVSLVRLVDPQRTSSAELRPGNRRNFHAVVADLSDTDAPSMATLSGASAEARMLHGLLADQGFALDEQTRATRESALHALHDPGAWVHFAAHGIAQPRRIGYSGVWLQPQAPETSPSFLSWLDILDQGVSADFVLLDACQLADSGTRLDGNLSFADAVSRAGAGRVVAAAWDISDSAWALWVPTFYSAFLTQLPQDSASALRTAQLRLRNSRAFTHPFYWAGMESFETLHLPADRAE